MARLVSRFSAVTGLALAMLFTPVTAQDNLSDPTDLDILDLIPSTASAAIAIRDIAEVKLRGDEFFTKTKVKSPMRVSDGFEQLVKFVGPEESVDDKGPLVLITFSNRLDLYDHLYNLALGVPIKDLDAFAKKLGITRQTLVSGDVINVSKLPGTGYSALPFLAVRGRHAFIGLGKDAIEKAIRGPSLGTQFPEDAKMTVADDDVVGFMTKPLMDELISFSTDSAKDFYDWFVDWEDEKTIERVQKELKWSLLGIRLDGGIGATIMFDFEGDQSRDLLTRLGRGNSRANLNGLPEGNILIAQALCTKGEEMASFARSMFGAVLEQTLANSGETIASARLSNLANLFGLSWQSCDQTRFALYENADPTHTGWFSLLAILDTEQAEQFVKDMVELAPFMHASGLTVTDAEETLGAKEIQVLVEDLGNKSYRIRQLAAIKLGLIGSPAIEALQAASKSEDSEVRLRSQATLAEIQRSLASERKNLLEKDLLSRIQPQLTYLPSQEIREDRRVDFIRLGLKGKGNRLAAQLRRLLGPQWNTIRVATFGNQVILMVGSDLSLFDAALAIAQTPQAKRVGHKRFEKFEQRSSDRRSGELHVSLARLKQLIDQDVDPLQRPDKASGNSSINVLISPQQIRADFFSPPEEIGVVVENLGL